jgi:hypothetical protein
MVVSFMPFDRKRIVRPSLHADHPVQVTGDAIWGKCLTLKFVLPNQSISAAAKKF